MKRIKQQRGFTLVELVTVIVVLGVLAAVAAPAYLDYRQDAKTSADTAAIAAIKVTLGQAFVRHQALNSPSSERITSVSQIAGLMHGGALPSNITVSGSLLQDQRGYSYALTAETATASARLTQISSTTTGPATPPPASPF